MTFKNHNYIVLDMAYGLESKLTTLTQLTTLTKLTRAEHPDQADPTE